MQMALDNLLNIFKPRLLINISLIHSTSEVMGASEIFENPELLHALEVNTEKVTLTPSSRGAQPPGTRQASSHGPSDTAAFGRIQLSDGHSASTSTHVGQGLC